MTLASMCMVGSSLRLRQPRQQNHPQQTKRPQRPSKVSRQRAIDFARRAFIRLPRAVSIIATIVAMCSPPRAHSGAFWDVCRILQTFSSPSRIALAVEARLRRRPAIAVAEFPALASRSLTTRERRGVSIVRKQLEVTQPKNAQYLPMGADGAKVSQI